MNSVLAPASGARSHAEVAPADRDVWTTASAQPADGDAGPSYCSIIWY